MKKIILIFIFALALILRFWMLGSNPPSLDWDEASLGYNAYSVLRTGRDEYGQRFPLAFRSFGDYKPPLYVYLTVPSIAIFGLNEFAVRLPSAVFGFLTVVILYLLLQELFLSEGRNKADFVSILATFFLAISPWHLQFSRVAFEANVALFFIVLGIYLFLRGLKKEAFLILGSLSFALSLYTYHSPRLIVPLLIIGLAVIFRRELWPKKKALAIAMLILFLAALPILHDLRSENGARFSSVTSLNPAERLGESIKLLEQDKAKGDLFGALTHNRRLVYGMTILGGYLDHFNFDFLFIDGDGPARHHAVGMGMLYLWDFIFVILGFRYLLREKKIKGLIIFWFLTAPIASSVTTGTPHAVRALFYLPVYQIIISLGFFNLYTYIIDRFGRLKGGLISSGVLILLVFNFLYYLHMYYIHTPLEASDWWQYGYKEVVGEVKKREGDFDRILVTYKYDQPYIFFLFYSPVDPSWYQKNWGSGEVLRAERKFGKLEFRNLDWGREQNLKKTLIVGTGEEIPENAPGIIKNIHFLNGQVAFRIVAR